MKKIGKQLLGALVALAMLFALAACNNTGTGAGSGSTDAGSSKTDAGSSNTDAGSSTLDFPKKDITLIVAYAAGGTTDLLARAVSTKMGEILGVNVIVQNVEGGGGTTGTSQAVNSAPDGYTLAVCSNGGYLVNPEVNDVGYTLQTTTPICMLSEIETAWGVSVNSPYMTLQDLIDQAKAAPGSITYVTPGAHCTPHLHAEYLGLQLGLEWNHSPNSSSPAAIAELIGGHIDAVFVNSPTFYTAYEDGDVRLLAITGDERDPNYPDTPTFAELGYDFPASVYFSIVGPAGMDPEVARRLADSVKQAMEDPTVQNSFESLNFPMSFTSGQEFADRLDADYAMYMDVMKELGIIS